MTWSRTGSIAAVVLSVVALGCDGSKRAPAGSSAQPAPSPGKPNSSASTPGKRFTPPSADQRRAAIGDLSRLPGSLQKAFAPSAQFSAIPAPSDGEWLAEHKEDGQSYDDYVASKPNLASGKRNTIYLVPVGKLDKPNSPKTSMLVDYVRRYYQLPVKMLPVIGLRDVSTYRRINRGSGKPQLLTGEILSLLKKRIPDDAYCLIAVTETDLYPQQSWNFVFGQASLVERVGVFSFARYHPSFHGGKQRTDQTTKKLVLLRALKVMVHEIGHMFGIQHCTHFSCVMNGSNSMDESDGQPAHLCPVCQRKLHHAKAYQPAKRYRQLGELYRKFGLSDQANWVGKRAAAIR